MNMVRNMEIKNMEIKTGDRVKVITHNYGRRFYELTGSVIDQRDNSIKYVIFDTIPRTKYTFFESDLQKI